MKTVTLEEAKEIISGGGVLVMPTDTAYGITCDVNNTEAVERIFNIKGREADKTFTIHIARLGMIDEWVENIPEDIGKLMNAFWPGDLNLVLQTYRFQKYITRQGENGNTVALRIPDHEVPQALSEHLGNAVIGTSANFSGKPTAYSLDELDPEFVAQTDGLIEGECGGVKESAVIGYNEKGLQIFREGRLTKDVLDKVLK